VTADQRPGTLPEDLRSEVAGGAPWAQSIFAKARSSRSDTLSPQAKSRRW